ncbi:hypothetical protein QUB68_16950 [Microcoleus sp. A006_D1]|uniref:hypothetical protein n=1 Tax=Microcoleus sp. A006_D1 TaxID=3055267 RepID=UPI002FD45BB8
MKKQLGLIGIHGIFVTSILLLKTVPVFAYCVYNRTDFDIQGEDIQSRSLDNMFKRWQRTTNPIPKGGKDCCPGGNSECTDPELKISVRVPDRDEPLTCKENIGSRDWLVVRTLSEHGRTKLVCEKNGKL